MKRIGKNHTRNQADGRGKTIAHGKTKWGRTRQPTEKNE